MFVLNSPNRQAFDERLSDARASRLALAAALALCLVGLSCASGCVSSNATAASNNAQGVEYFTAGDYDNAIARFQDSLEENPESAETYYNLGSAFQRKANETGDLNLLTKAEDAYWTALQMNPAPETIVCCYRGIATSATARGDSAGAMQTLEEWRDRNPDSIEPRLEIAYLLEAQERDDDAYDALKEIAEMAPNDYRAFYKMGVLSERAGDLDDAIEQTNAAALLTSKSEIAQRARSLEAQYAAKQRKQEKEGGVEPTSTESTLAVGPIPASQTTRVQSTSAQAESEAVPELVLPEETAQPIETPVPQAQPTSATQSLGFGEVVVLSRENATDQLVSNVSPLESKQDRTNTTRFVQNAAATTSSQKDKDSDVKWISAISSPDANVAQTSASVPQKSTTEPVQEPEKEVAPTTANVQVAQPAVVPGPILRRKTDDYYKPKKQPTEMGSGFPKMKAGSFF